MMILGYFLARSGKALGQLVYRGLAYYVGPALNLGLNLHLLILIVTAQVEMNPYYMFGVDILFLAGFGMILINPLSV